MLNMSGLGLGPEDTEPQPQSSMILQGFRASWHLRAPKPMLVDPFCNPSTTELSSHKNEKTAT